ncbi:MAG TPA: DMT family transporter [Bdellovibrionota bacterium]|nr:DMT family transporter [Bdellovibrionota bacterium]
MNRGISWMLVAVFLFACMGACAKAASGAASTGQILFFRSVVGLPILVLLARRWKAPLLGSRSPLLVTRGIIGFFSLALYFFSLVRIPYGNAAVLQATSPIFVAFLAFPIVGERVSRKIFWLLPFFITGIALIVRPQAHRDLLPHLAAIGAGFLGSLAYLSVRKLSERDRGITIVFYFHLIATLASLPLAWIGWRPFNYRTAILLLGGGFFGTLAQLTMTRAYKLERASVISLFFYGIPFLAFIFGVLFFGERPDAVSLAGAVLIISCGLVATQIPRFDKPAEAEM